MREEANKYRPITLVVALSQILKKVISNHLIYFVGKHNILNKSQSGFRKNNFKKDAISMIIENII
jgi:hypothetical protein